MSDLSLAERMWRNRRNDPNPQTEEPEGESEAFPESGDRDEIFDRVDHVLNGLQSLLPQGIKVKQVAILTEIMRGMQRDISLVPPAEVGNFMRAISEATAWIADGSMADLEDTNGAGLSEDSPEER